MGVTTAPFVASFCNTAVSVPVIVEAGIESWETLTLVESLHEKQHAITTMAVILNNINTFFTGEPIYIKIMCQLTFDHIGEN
jgi:hypothetical protein